MYLEYFGLAEAPFSITPDPAFVFLSQRHRDALAHLLYGVGQGGSGGFVQLTGEVGTGKTTLCRCLLEQVPENTRIALVLNPLMTPQELLAAICEASPPRGECTIVIGGAIDGEDEGRSRWPDGELEDMIRLELAGGVSTRDLARDLAERSGRARREIYAKAVSVRGESRDKDPTGVSERATSKVGSDPSDTGTDAGSDLDSGDRGELDEST